MSRRALVPVPEMACPSPRAAGLLRIVALFAVLAAIQGLTQFGPSLQTSAGQGEVPNTTELLPPPIEMVQPPPASPEDLGRQQVADVLIIGNESIQSDRVHSLIRTRKGRPFDPEVLQQDKRNLMAKGLFRDVHIATQQTSHGIVVTFEVFERPTVRFIRFLGDRGIGERALKKEIGLKEGDALNFYAVEEARRKIEDLYHRKGYPKAQVTIGEGNRPEDRGVVFIVSEGPLQRIASVRFTGNSDIASDSRLKTQIESKPGFLKYLFRGKLDQDKIATDVDKLTAYYRSLGFFRARVSRELEFDEKNQWVHVNFVIDEGPRYVVRNVSVLGNEKFATNDLMSSLQLRAGEYFRLEYMQSDVNSLRDVYGGQGYIFADIEAEPRFLEEPGELDLVYNIAEGEQFRVGRINVRIAGDHPHTKERVVLDRLSIKPGQIVDIREIRNSERRLKASQLFIVNPAEGDPPQIVVVPPDLQDAQEVIASNKNREYRGQSPDEGARTIDLEVLTPPLIEQ